MIKSLFLLLINKKFNVNFHFGLNAAAHFLCNKSVKRGKLKLKERDVKMKIKALAAAMAVYLAFIPSAAAKEYKLTNRIDDIAGEELSDMRRVISACADIMSFDIKDYDYDTLFRYVLYTHENFRILTDIPPLSASSVTVGNETVYLAGEEFIDYVMENVFMITPVKPPSGELVTRGFCCSDGYYFYTGGFDIFFSTDIREAEAVYALGGNTFCIVFSDTYREGDTYVNEKSYAVVRKTDGKYVLLRLGMGGGSLSYDEARTYSPFVYFSDGAWKSTEQVNQ